MSGESPASCYMEDPPGSVDIRLSTLILVETRVRASFWVKPIKGSGLVSKCDLTDVRHDVNLAMRTRIQVTCVSPINFPLRASTNIHFNFLGVRVGSNGPTVPHSSWSRLKTTVRS